MGGFKGVCQVTNPDRLTNVIQSAAWSLVKQWQQTDWPVSWMQQLLLPPVAVWKNSDSPTGVKRH